MTVNHYPTKFGVLAISDTTVQRMKRTGESSGLLHNDTPKLQRLEGLGDFCQFDLPKTGENIGTWLHRTHSQLAAQPSFIGSHVVDGASNAQASVEELKWQSRAERPQTITSRSCIAHETSTSATRGSGTSSHQHNMNPQAGVQLKKATQANGCTQQERNKEGSID